MTIWPSHELCYPCAPCSSQIPCNPGISQCCERGPHTERAGTFPSLSLESGGKRVYMMKSFGSLSYSIDNKAEMTFFCVYLHMHEWFISKPPEMLQKTSSSLYPLTQSEQTVSANCCLFRDVSVLLRQHWRRLSTHRCSKVQHTALLYEETDTHIHSCTGQTGSSSAVWKIWMCVSRTWHYFIIVMHKSATASLHKVMYSWCINLLMQRTDVKGTVQLFQSSSMHESLFKSLADIAG